MFVDFSRAFRKRVLKTAPEPYITLYHGYQKHCDGPFILFQLFPYVDK